MLAERRARVEYQRGGRRNDESRYADHCTKKRSRERILGHTRKNTHKIVGRGRRIMRGGQHPAHEKNRW